MLEKIKLFLVGIALVGLGVFAIAVKFLLGEDARLPFWPFDGIAAIIGGVFVTWWSARVLSENEEDDRALSDRES
jgi:hypothetical protein